MDIRFEGVALARGDFALSADLTIPAGCRVAVIGPSGAGKTTLLDLIAGFAEADRGRILIGGEDHTRTGPAARPVSMIFQDNNLFPHLSVAKNVALGRSAARRLDPETRRAVGAALAAVGLSDLADRRPGALSGGQRSRVALARALLRDRPVLLLDEPFGALGPAMRADLLAHVSDLQRDRGTTVLMVTHDPADAAAFADWIVFVDKGRVAPPAEAAALLADPPPALRAYLRR